MKNTPISKIILLLLLSSVLVCCKREHTHSSIFLKAKNNPYNTFNLSRSGYSYHGKEIFTVNFPRPFLHRDFLKSNYLILDKQKINLLEIRDGCKTSYINGDYKIEEDFVGYNFCNIYITPFIDFSLNPGDSLKFYYTKIWLDNKFYDETIKDTLYKFRRYEGVNPGEQIQTIILASKSIGIVGAYDTSLVFKLGRENPIGYTHKANPIPISSVELHKPAINLKTIKEFELDN